MSEFDPNEILLDYQKAVIADESEVVVVEKSRRVGVSWGIASKAAMVAAAGREAGGNNVFYVGYNQDMARDFIGDVAMWAKAFHGLALEIQEVVFKDKDKDILVFEVHFESGFRVQALSSRPSNLRGKQGMVIIDEAAFHNDLEELIKAALALLIWGGQVYIISTHDGEDNYFNELILDVRGGKLPYSPHKITFTDALRAGLYKRICQRKRQTWSQDGEDAWKEKLYKQYGAAAEEELDVIPKGGGGAPLSRAQIEKAQRDVPLYRFAVDAAFKLAPKDERERVVAEWCEENLAGELAALNPRLLHFFGEDFGSTGDVTAIWPIQQQPNMDLHTPFVVELRNMPFEQQRQILFYILDRLPRFVGGAMDARGNGEYLAQVAQQEYGERVIAVMLSQAWYRENMPRLIDFFEDGTITIPRHADVMLDLRCLKTEKGITKIPEGKKYAGTDGLPRHGDLAIGLAMAAFAARSPIQEFDYQPAVDNEEGRIDWRNAGGF